MYDTQPYSLRSEMDTILNLSAIMFSDSKVFHSFAISIQFLVGMLGTLGMTKWVRIQVQLPCGSPFKQDASILQGQLH